MRDLQLEFQLADQKTTVSIRIDKFHKLLIADFDVQQFGYIGILIELVGLE
jgi:hypothetical protein